MIAVAVSGIALRLLHGRKTHSAADRDLIGNSRRIGPHAFADPEVETLDLEFALGDAIAAGVLAQRDRNRNVARDTFHRAPALALVAVTARAAHRGRFERRDRELRGIEPCRSPRLDLGLLAREIDARKLHLANGFRFPRALGAKIDVCLPFPETSFDGAARLFGHEAYFAAIDEHALCAGARGRRQQHDGERRNERMQHFHRMTWAGFRRANGSMRRSVSSRSTYWCLNAAPTWTMTSTNRMKFNVAGTAHSTPASTLSFATRSGNGKSPR